VHGDDGLVGHEQVLEGQGVRAGAAHRREAQLAGAVQRGPVAGRHQREHHLLATGIQGSRERDVDERPAGAPGLAAT
jgi:hypothetical protein